eukprot:506411-Rhodomonas_salina.1
MNLLNPATPAERSDPTSQDSLTFERRGRAQNVLRFSALSASRRAFQLSERSETQQRLGIEMRIMEVHAADPTRADSAYMSIRVKKTGFRRMRSQSQETAFSSSNCMFFDSDLQQDTTAMGCSSF